MHGTTEATIVDDLVARARTAQRAYEAGADQQRYDMTALAAAWALMEPGRNRELSELAVATTGLGNVADKIAKNERKTLGLLRDIKGAATTGVRTGRFLVVMSKTYRHRRWRRWDARVRMARRIVARLTNRAGVDRSSVGDLVGGHASGQSSRCGGARAGAVRVGSVGSPW